MYNKVTILILIDGFLQLKTEYFKARGRDVTILILIDGFLQYGRKLKTNWGQPGHNPYFNRWFSAITVRMYKQEYLLRSQSLF